MALCVQNLDIQYTVGLATNVPTTFVSVGSNQEFGGFLHMMNDLLDLEDGPPLVITTSYGFDEASLTTTQHDKNMAM